MHLDRRRLQGFGAGSGREPTELYARRRVANACKRRAVELKPPRKSPRTAFFDFLLGAYRSSTLVPQKARFWTVKQQEHWR